MFVQDNSINSCLSYIKSRLENQFSQSEIRQIQRAIFQKMFSFNAADLLLQGNYRLTESELLQVRDVVKRLQANEPLQYIIGYTEFCELQIRCDKRALIPRPETEELVWKVLEFPALQKSQAKILDLCTGTGCIALALKNQKSDASVVALDYDSTALALANENATELNLDISCVLGNALDLSEVSTLSNQKWTLIVSNPPYIPQAEKALMAANVLDFEPHIALFVEDADPLIFYKRIAEFAIEHLEENGLLAFELHENLAQKTANFCTNLGFSAVEIFEDMQGKQRMLLTRI